MSNKGKSIHQSPRTVEAGQEFGTAGKGIRLINTALHSLLKYATKEHKLSSRLSSKLLQVVQSDPVNDLGKRCINDGNLSLLEGFDFYLKHPLLRHVPSMPTARIDRRCGKCVIGITKFTPSEWLPDNCTATHITIVAAATAIDFNLERFETFTGNSIALPVEQNTGVSFGFDAPKGNALPVMVVVGVQFNKVVNGKSYPMSGQSLMVVRVDMSHTDRWKAEGSPKEPGSRKKKKIKV